MRPASGLRFHKLNLQLEFVGKPNIVRIEKGEIFTAFASSKIARMGHSTIAMPGMFKIANLSGKSVRIFLSNLCALVGGPIVDEEQFPPRIGL